MKPIRYLEVVVFLSSFLLFQIELIIAKILLPKFGGSYTVWAAALVFFQSTLLLGYLYAHLLQHKLGVFGARYLHLGLLFFVLIFFPGLPLPAISALNRFPMVVEVFLQLALAIGPVFFFLSANSVIYQAWLANSDLPQRINPYALYAVSNCGALLGLFTYPVFFETVFGSNAQLVIWRIACLVLFIVQIVVFKLIPVRNPEKDSKAGEPMRARVKLKDRMLWFVLSSAGVMIFLSVTNMITYEIAPMPLLWVVPLGIYLLSFTLNFKQEPWCPKWVTEKSHLVIISGGMLFFITQQRMLPPLLEAILYLFMVFWLCMFCQKKLYEHKPHHAQDLTRFYLVIAFGGFIGSLCVSWLMPLVSNVMAEYLVALFLVSLAAVIDEEKVIHDRLTWRCTIYFVVFCYAWPVVFKTYNVWGLILLMLFAKATYSLLRVRIIGVTLGLFGLICLLPFQDRLCDSQGNLYAYRNHYGICRIIQGKQKRFLINGPIIHGAQYITEEKRRMPLTYHHETTPVGQVLKTDLFDFKSVAVMGLGAGTLAAYGKEGQVFDFFELDPDALRIARKYFTYLEDSPAKTTHYLGDARGSLLKRPDASYDLIIMDAFSGDAVPVHLLTTEAITECFRCLSERGLILFDVSNRYVDLVPPLLANAKVLSVKVCYASNVASKNDDAFASSWVAVTRDPGTFLRLVRKLKWHDMRRDRRIKKIRPWTDDYSNIATVLEYDNIASHIKEFRPFYW